MLPVFLAQWMKEKRSPYMVLIFIVLSIVATFLFGSHTETKLRIDAFSGEGIAAAEAEQWLDRLNEAGPFLFTMRSEENVIADVRQGRLEMAVKLLENDFRIISVRESGNANLVQQHMQSIYTEELKIKAAAQHSNDTKQIRDVMKVYLEQPPMSLQSSTPTGNALESYNMGLQLLFGFTLFLVIFTIGFKVNAVTAEKVSGIWNRVILSPVTKTQMYFGHLTYSTLIGIVQITIVFCLFKYVLGYDLGVNAAFLTIISVLYIISTVAMSMLFTGMFKTPEQFRGFFSSVVPMMPVLSGVYMPPGTITSEVMLWISEFFPIKHAMDALIGVSMYQQGWGDIYLSLAKLLLMTVIFFGIGINMVERRRA
ncbi:ABC transporter permease [Paenibacillus sp. SC116]|uniref:ABC transporter permease n=1 Tax=Paenibacillus sp. SC116 TaxID=2968986 RepID=UPI00215AE5D7|nr:ABC transporter permease [Paenibacillus sp. SC116]MCR8842333.1 ABC transporter permease [Paenibacillus sp. SC116]